MSVCNSVIKNIYGFMKSNGFSKKNQCFFKLEGDIAFCIEFEAPCELIYVNCYIIPLYIPTEYRYCTYGIRFNITWPIDEKKSKDIDLCYNSLKQELSSFVLPSFERITTPNIFLDQVRTRHFFNQYDCYISDIYVQRLRLFTALYQKQYDDLLELSSIYESAVTNATGITQSVKNKHYTEIQCLRNLTITDDEGKNDYITHVIEATKQKCFGLKTNST